MGSGTSFTGPLKIKKADGTKVTIADADGNLTAGVDLSEIRDVNGNEMLEFDAVASAVNFARLANSATGNAVVLSAQGDDTNISVNIDPKGTGVVDIGAADDLTVGGVIVPQELEVSFHGQAATAMVDQSFFLATQAYQVTKISFVHAVAETSAANLRVQVTKDTSTNAPGAGNNLLTNNSNNGFDGKATANTVQTGTLTATTADLQLAAGDRLSVDFEASATELVGVTITVSLKRI